VHSFAVSPGMPRAMPLLIDTDLFCDLGSADLLRDAVEVLGYRVCDCARLPALPHMLRRGRLVRRYGPQACEDLIPLAEEMASAPDPRGAWFDKLAGMQDVDPGEAQLLAAAANAGLDVMTGDERALRAVRLVEGLAEALSGRLVTRAAILLALCNTMGSDAVRIAVGALREVNTTVRICFSSASVDPREGLQSYHRNAVEELSPLVLWDPLQGGEVER
jgi:hypothetical protein